TFLFRHLRRRRAEQELDEEIRTHLELELQQNMAEGMSPEEARYAALRAFGNVSRAKEDSRAVWGFRSIETWWQDLRYGLRMLLKKLDFTLIVVLTLALGIGANMAIFTVVNAALLRGLPYRDPEALVHLWETTPQTEFPQREASYPDYLDW